MMRERDKRGQRISRNVTVHSMTVYSLVEFICTEARYPGVSPLADANVLSLRGQVIDTIFSAARPSFELIHLCRRWQRIACHFNAPSPPQSGGRASESNISEYTRGDSCLTAETFLRPTQRLRLLETSGIVRYFLLR